MVKFIKMSSMKIELPVDSDVVHTCMYSCYYVIYFSWYFCDYVQYLIAVTSSFYS